MLSAGATCGKIDASPASEARIELVVGGLEVFEIEEHDRDDAAVAHRPRAARGAASSASGPPPSGTVPSNSWRCSERRSPRVASSFDREAAVGQSKSSRVCASQTSRSARVAQQAAALVEHQIRRHARLDARPVARVEALDAQAIRPRRRVREGIERRPGRDAADQRVEARERLGFALVVEEFVASDAAIGVEDEEPQERPLECAAALAPTPEVSQRSSNTSCVAASTS